MNRGRIFACAVYLLPFIAVTVFMVIPLVSVISEAFRGTSGDIDLSLTVGILNDPKTISIIAFTFKQTVLSTLATLLLAIPGAYVLSRYRFPGRSVLMSLTTVPFILPPLVLAIGFFTLFGTSGHVNELLSNTGSLLGVELPSLKILYSLEGIVLAHVFLNFPVALRLTESGFSSADRNLERASRSLGKGPVSTFLKVSLPRIRYSLIAAASLVFTFCFLSFGVILVVGGGSNHTIETEIYRQFTGNLDFQRAGVLLLVETVIVSLTTGIYVWASGRARGAGSLISPVSSKTVDSKRIGWLAVSALIVYSLLVSFLILGPMVSVVRESLTTGDVNGFYWFEQAMSGSEDPLLGASPLGAILNSLIFAFLCSLITVPLSILIGYLLHRKAGPVRIPLHTLMLMPLGISSIGLGYGLIKAYSGTMLDLSGTWYIIVIIHVLLSYPFGARTIHAGLASIPPDLKKASRSLGMGPVRTFLRVELPLLAPSIIVAALFSFAISIGEFGATLMVSSSTRFVTMPVALYRFMGSGRQYGAATAYASIMIVVTFVCFLAIEYLGRIMVRRRDAL